MYKIVFKDLGQDRVTKEIDSTAGHIKEAESIASGFINDVLGGRDFDITRLESIEYVVFAAGVPVGSFTIIKLH